MGSGRPFGESWRQLRQRTENPQALGATAECHYPWEVVRMAERQCLRCGAPYDEGATVCFTCGASIGELETPTQPVRAPKGPFANATPSATSDAPPEAPPQAPVATATQSQGRPLTVGSHYPSPALATHPPRRSRWPLVVGLLVVVALIAGGAFVARALLAPPPVPRTITYHDQQQRFSFAEPALWTVTPRSDGALLADSSGANTLTITVAPDSTGQTADAVANALATQQSLQSARAIAIAGDQWERRTGAVTGADGATRVVTLYVDVHAGFLYTIQTSSPTSVATSINTLVYQPLLASFTFS